MPFLRAPSQHTARNALSWVFPGRQVRPAPRRGPASSESGSCLPALRAAVRGTVASQGAAHVQRPQRACAEQVCSCRQRASHTNPLVYCYGHWLYLKFKLRKDLISTAKDGIKKKNQNMKYADNRAPSTWLPCFKHLQTEITFEQQ